MNKKNKKNNMKICNKKKLDNKKNRDNNMKNK